MGLFIIVPKTAHGLSPSLPLLSSPALSLTYLGLQWYRHIPCSQMNQDPSPSVPALTLTAHFPPSEPRLSHPRIPPTQCQHRKQEFACFSFVSAYNMRAHGLFWCSLSPHSVYTAASSLVLISQSLFKQAHSHFHRNASPRPLCHHHPGSLLSCQLSFLCLLLTGHQELGCVPYCHTERDSGYVLITRGETEAEYEREGKPGPRMSGTLQEPACQPLDTLHHTQGHPHLPATSSGLLISFAVLPKSWKSLQYSFDFCSVCGE